MIRVIIERQVPDSLEKQYALQTLKLQQKALSFPGYVSGEALLDVLKPEHRVTLSNWETIQDWQKWYASAERSELMAQLKPMLEHEEKILVLEKLR